jgi:hypothetical protein
MNRMSRTVFSASAVALLALGISSNAQADIILDGGLTLNTSPSVIYQQTAASPCVIGGSNCLNGTFDYTVEGPGGAGSLSDGILSPVYDVSDIEAIVGGTTFTMGLDYNQNVDPQTLYLFTATYDVGGSQTFDLTTVLQTNNNGVGFSDFLLSGFIIPAGATTVQFTATWFNNDGADRYFLVGAAAQPLPAVPEPATLSLFGMGLLGVARRAMRRKA